MVISVTVQDKKLIIVNIDEQQDLSHTSQIITELEKKHDSICYVCTNNLYHDIKNQLHKEGLDISKFYFIDILSSHYKEKVGASDCKFVSAPSETGELENAIFSSVNKMNCSLMVFDSISELLMYDNAFNLVKMTNNIVLKADKLKQICLIVQKDGITHEDNKLLLKDLLLFADSLIDLKQVFKS